MTAWMDVARAEIGVRDFPGPRYEPRNWCMLKSGNAGTIGADAPSWLTYGQQLATPQDGSIVVLWREDPKSWKGHVGFFQEFEGNRERLLGGNQGGGVGWDELCITTFPVERVLGYRWP